MNKVARACARDTLSLPLDTAQAPIVPRWRGPLSLYRGHRRCQHNGLTATSELLLIYEPAQGDPARGGAGRACLPLQRARRPRPGAGYPARQRRPPARPGRGDAVGYLYLLCEASQFRPDDELLPPTAHHLRRVLFDRSGDERLPAWVAALPDRPTVFATLGTFFGWTPGVFAAILAGLRDEPLNLVHTVGRDLDPATFGPQPAGVHIERYIPQSLLLPSCAAVVSHCGSGTLYAALDHGLPQVNIPIAADQPENAARCVALGVGVTVGPDERTPEAIRAAVREVLANPTYRQSAERLRDDMAALRGPEHAVALLERLAVERRPIVSA